MTVLHGTSEAMIPYDPSRPVPGAPPADWVLTYSRQGRGVVVGVHGELDMATAPELRRGLIDLIENQGNRSVVVDLRGVRFFGSSGLAVLVEADRRLRDVHGTFVLADPPPMARRVLELTSLVEVLDVREYV
jgi:anti-sigma B factor antagonist